MFLLKNEGGRWSAAKYSFATEANDSLEILKTHFSVQTANPKPETIDVQRKIDKLDISKFRDYEKIEGYSACMGTSGIILESLKQGKYHKNFCPCWNTVSTDIKEIKAYRVLSTSLKQILDSITNKIVYELKLFNPKAMAQGKKQLQPYIKELQTMPDFKGIQWQKF